MGEGLEKRKSKEKVDYIGGNALEEDRTGKWGNKGPNKDLEKWR